MQAAVIALYLFQQSQSGMHSATLIRKRAALKWFHSFAPSGGANPLDDALCLNILEQVKRRRRGPITKKTPLTTDIIKKLIDRFAHAQASLKDLRIATFCTLGFAGFSRFNEIVSIQANHLIFMESCVKIFVPRSKIDVYLEGNYVFIAKSNSKYRPVHLLARYLKEAKIDPRCSLPIFRPLVKTKRVYMLREGKLSYSRYIPPHLSTRPPELCTSLPGIRPPYRNFNLGYLTPLPRQQKKFTNIFRKI